MKGELRIVLGASLLILAGCGKIEVPKVNFHYQDPTTSLRNEYNNLQNEAKDKVDEYKKRLKSDH